MASIGNIFRLALLTSACVPLACGGAPAASAESEPPVGELAILRPWERPAWKNLEELRAVRVSREGQKDFAGRPFALEVAATPLSNGEAWLERYTIAARTGGEGERDVIEHVAGPGRGVRSEWWSSDGSLVRLQLEPGGHQLLLHLPEAVAAEVPEDWRGLVVVDTSLAALDQASLEALTRDEVWQIGHELLDWSQAPPEQATKPEMIHALLRAQRRRRE